MSDQSNAKDMVEAVTGLVKAVPVYQDVLQPAAQEVGKGLQTAAKLVHVALAPVAALVWGFDQIKDFVSTKVADRLKHLPPEDIVTPKPNVAGPALEALRYTGHQEALSDMYANLLAASMDKSMTDGAHPAFVEIIRQLTPDEAKLLTLLLKRQPHPVVDILAKFTPESRKSGVETVLQCYSHLGIDSGCTHAALTPTYLSNLSRLGLIEMPVGKSYTGPGVYDRLEKDEAVVQTLASIEKIPQMKPVINRGSVFPTPLGRLFGDVCVTRKIVSSVV